VNCLNKKVTLYPFVWLLCGSVNKKAILYPFVWLFVNNMNKKVTLSLLSDYRVFEQCEQEGQSLCLAVSCVNNVNKKVSLSPCLAVCCLNSVNKKDTPCLAVV